MSNRFRFLAGPLFAIGAMFAITTTTTWAEVPDSINYQGTLSTAGAPVADGNYSVTFRIYDVAVGGTALWTETQSVATLNGGFSALLGSVTALPPTVFSGPNRFLGLTVSPDPEMTPRTPIVAVPYAYRIATIDGAIGGSVSGNLDLEHSTAATGNVLKNGVPFIHDFGTDNTFIGQNAGNLTMSGSGNTSCGSGSLQSNTIGYFNTACGANALRYNTEGELNTATGREALRANTIGYSNTADGALALATNIYGSANTANGAEALGNNLDGYFNTANGYHALRSNITGYSNSATGTDALYSNTFGDDNTATGRGALYANTTASKNTADGYGSLASNTTGSRNTAVGYVSLFVSTVGNNNTASGSHALFANTTGNNNTASGHDVLYTNTTGSANTAMGDQALRSNTTGSNNTALGNGADVTAPALTNATAIGNNAKVDASNKIRLGNGAITVLECEVGLTVVSDRNQKEHIQPVNGDEVLQKLRTLDLSSWNLKGQDPEQFRHYGPMAQEFFAAFGHDGIGTIGTPTTINSSDMAGIMMVAIQALERNNEQQKAENQELRDQVAELREMIVALSNK